jgi:PPOX class probable F420-dependent enzyme
MREMAEPEWVDFLRRGTKTAKLSVNLPSGRPTVTPVWFLYDEDGIIRIETGRRSAKARALPLDPRACIVVDLEEPPYGFVKIDTHARIVDDPLLTTRVATGVGARYMGPERAAEFGKRNSGPGQVVIEFTPTRVTAITDITE